MIKENGFIFNWDMQWDIEYMESLEPLARAYEEEDKIWEQNHKFNNTDDLEDLDFVDLDDFFCSECNIKINAKNN